MLKQESATVRLLNDHRDIILASFGIDGIKSSELKAPLLHQMVLELVGESTGVITKRAAIDMIFEDLELMYKSDSQFFGFPLDELDRFIIEERTYMIGYMAA